MKEKDWNGNKKTLGASNHSEKELKNNTQEDMKNIAEYIDYLEQENAELKIQRDYEYSLYNKTLEEAGKALTKRGEDPMLEEAISLIEKQRDMYVIQLDYLSDDISIIQKAINQLKKKIQILDFILEILTKR